MCSSYFVFVFFLFCICLIIVFLFFRIHTLFDSGVPHLRRPGHHNSHSKRWHTTYLWLMTSWVQENFSVAFWFYSQIYGWRLIDRNVYSAFTCNSAMISEKWKGQIADRGRTKYDWQKGKVKAKCQRGLFSKLTNRQAQI